MSNREDDIYGSYSPRNRMTDEEVTEWQHNKTYGNDCSCCGAFKSQCTCGQTNNDLKKE